MAISEVLELEMGQAFAQVEELRAAIETATSTVAVSVDVSEIAPAVTEAVGGAQANVEVVADAAAVTDEIESAVAAADATVDVDANVSGLEDATAGVQNLDKSTQDAKKSTVDLQGATLALGAGVGALPGPLTAAASKFGPYGVGAAVAAGAILFIVDAAAEAAQALRVFNDALGASAAAVERVDIAGLDTTLSDLALSLGADDDALRLAIARIATLGNTAGIAQPQIAATAEQVLVLAAAVTAANPALGTADQVAGRLFDALARGGRTTAAFGLSLDPMEIKLRAAENAGKAATAEFSRFELSAAGAQLAVEKLGPAIGTSIAKGQEDAATKLRSLGQLFSETVEQIGGPLVESISAVATAIRPVVDLVGKNFTLAFKLAAAPVGLVVLGLKLLEPVLNAVGDVVGFVSDRIDDLVGQFERAKGILDVILGPLVDFEDAAGDVVGPVIAAGDAIAELPAKIEPADNSIRDLLDAFEPGLTDAATSLQDFASSADQSVAEFVTSMSDAARAAENFGGNTARIAALGGDTINRAIAQIADPATRALVAQRIAELDDTAIGAIEAGQERILTAADTQAAAVVDSLVGPLIANAPQIAAAAELSRSGWHVFVEVAESEALKVGPALNTALIPVDISAAAESTGASYGEGFKRGLTAAGAQAIAEARSIASQVIAEVRRVGNTESPSKVMAAIGEDYTLGFAQGIAARQGEVEFAVQKIAEAAAAEAAGNRDLARARENEVRFLFDEILTRQEQIAVLDRAIATEERYSDAWVRHTTERRRLLEEVTREEEQAAQQRQQATDTAIRDLERLLREEEEIAKRRVDAAESAAEEIARAERQLADGRREVSEDLARTLDAEDRRLRESVASRREQLERGLDVTSRFRPDAGLSIGRLISNIDEQNRALVEFGRSLEQLRARGVSDAAIGGLGLAEGPQALGQIRRILAGSAEEIAALNREFKERGGLIGGQARRDSAGVAAEVSAAKILARELALAEIEGLEETFAAEQGRISSALSVTLSVLDTEAAAIGRDAGVTLGNSIARGLGSTNEAIRRVAQQALDLGAVPGANGQVQVFQIFVQPGGSVDDALRARR